MIDVALIGCGHMGTHHARIVSAHPACRLVATVDVVPERARRLAERHGARAMDVVPAEADAVVVATPTTTHVRVARPLLARGQWCLVEKPVASDLQALRGLTADRLVVGHSERFNPAMRSVDAPRGGEVEVRRCVPPTARCRDVDVVLDLMIHDLDLLLWWAKDAGGGAITTCAGDADQARVELSVGSLRASLYASRISPTPERRIAVRRQGEADTLLDLLRGCAQRGPAPLSPPDDQDALTAQWEAFVAAVRGGPRAVSLQDGVRALELALQIRQHLQRSAA